VKKLHARGALRRLQNHWFEITSRLLSDSLYTASVRRERQTEPRRRRGSTQGDHQEAKAKPKRSATTSAQVLQQVPTRPRPVHVIIRHGLRAVPLTYHSRMGSSIRNRRVTYSMAVTDTAGYRLQSKCTAAKMRSRSKLTHRQKCPPKAL